VIDWNRGPLASLARRPLEGPRVEVRSGSVIDIVEGGLNSAVTLAENQLSLPEIVYSFTEFIEMAAKEYQIIIGIDELDKLESDEKAQLFLNDIKSIFGIERCFFRMRGVAEPRVKRLVNVMFLENVCRDERQLVNGLSEFGGHASRSNGHEANSDDGRRNLPRAIMGRTEFYGPPRWGSAQDKAGTMPANL
jgi:hypothetical protein